MQKNQKKRRQERSSDQPPIERRGRHVGMFNGGGGRSEKGKERKGTRGCARNRFDEGRKEPVKPPRDPACNQKRTVKKKEEKTAWKLRSRSGYSYRQIIRETGSTEGRHNEPHESKLWEKNTKGTGCKPARR